ncbi:hypothetical protein DFJ73DRAFT_756826 [Zopfochytrium polystomum]|nr:hypothetical protein DFJ73DRAFT_756826 [Zopfochytrium polystomum]
MEVSSSSALRPHDHLLPLGRRPRSRPTTNPDTASIRPRPPPLPDLPQLRNLVDTRRRHRCRRSSLDRAAASAAVTPTVGDGVGGGGAVTRIVGTDTTAAGDDARLVAAAAAADNAKPPQEAPAEKPTTAHSNDVDDASAVPLSTTSDAVVGIGLRGHPV